MRLIAHAHYAISTINPYSSAELGKLHRREQVDLLMTDLSTLVTANRSSAKGAMILQLVVE